MQLTSATRLERYQDDTSPRGILDLLQCRFAANGLHRTIIWH